MYEQLQSQGSASVESPKTKNQILLAAAEQCLANGWAIIPIDPNGKTPYACSLNDKGFPLRWQNGVHSVYSASFGPPRKYTAPKSGKVKMTTPALQAWWDGHECNPAVALELSDLTVLDIDEGIESEAELLEFCSEFNIPRSRAVRSGRTSSFGAHIYYQGGMTSDSYIIPWRGKIVKGEVKSKHKYVIAEGGIHKSGQAYTRLWDIPIESTPVAFFTEFLEKHAPAKPVYEPSAPSDGKATTRENMEQWFEKSGEDVSYVGFHKGKQADMFVRTDGCPWKNEHKTESHDTDFAIFLDAGGKLSAKCMHESCKPQWVQLGCWKSYRAWVEKKVGRSIPLSPGTVYSGSALKKAGLLPNGSSVSEETMSETQTQEQSEVETGLTVEVEPEPKPVFVLSDTCLDGRLGEICQKYLSKFPHEYSWSALVTAASALYPHPNDGNVITPATNLYANLVGPLHSGKSQAIWQATSILGLREGDQRLVEAKFGSAELLLKHLMDRLGRTVLWSPDELRHVMDKAGIQHASFASIMCSIFGQHNGMVSTSGGKDYAIKHQVSLLGGTPVDDFGDAFGAATLGGLYDRFILGLFPEGHPEYPYCGEDWRLLDPAGLSPVVVTIHPSVYECVDAWKKDHPDCGRCGEIATRMARICASMSGKTILHGNDMTPALAFAEYQYVVRKILKPNPGDNPIAKCAFKITTALRRVYPAWMRKRTLEKVAHKERIGPHLWEMTMRSHLADVEMRNVCGKLEYRLKKEAYDCI